MRNLFYMRLLKIIGFILGLWIILHYVVKVVYKMNKENFEISTAEHSFCKINTTSSSGGINNKCNQLTYKNCNKTDCCIFEKDNKCVAGNSNGPILNTDENGKTKQVTFFYKNKCYGNKCS